MQTIIAPPHLNFPEQPVLINTQFAESMGFVLYLHKISAHAHCVSRHATYTFQTVEIHYIS
jgi:hypothetical protein